VQYLPHPDMLYVQLSELLFADAGLVAGPEY
jgi:hypothetical protein